MAGSVNKVILIGNLGKDPEIRQTQDGRKIANFNVATSESWKDKNTGERREKTEWHRVVLFEPISKVADYLKKGSKVYLEGSLQTRKWQDQSGQDKYTTEVVLHDARQPPQWRRGTSRAARDDSGTTYPAVSACAADTASGGCG